MRQKNNIRIVFFGTPEFAAKTLESLHDEFYVLAAVTPPDKPRGRKMEILPSPIKQHAQTLGIPLFQPQSAGELKDFIKNIAPDMGVIFSYSKILPKDVIDIFPFGILNIHPSLLPRYRGPSPVQAAILNGEEKTGVTIIMIDDKMDHGPILAQEEVMILPHETAPELLNRLSEKGAQMLLQIIPQWFAKKIHPREQNHDEASFCKMILRNDGKIDLSASADLIYRQYRAYYGWPGVFTEIEKKRIKILEMEIARAPGPIGSISIINGNPAIFCGGGAIILKKILPESRRPMTGKDFLIGLKNFNNSNIIH